jgi:hypothetical protein
MTPPGQVPGDVVAAAPHAEEVGFESVWAVDQLVAGTGAPVFESVVTLSAVASATSRIGLGFGVMIAPLCPVAWIAKQVATLQHLSGRPTPDDRRHVAGGAAAGGPLRRRLVPAAGPAPGRSGRP